MFCPPVPWVSVKTGGYLIAPCDMVRLPSQAVAQKQRLEEADPRNIYPSIDSLNQLTAVPWRVNPQILDVILNVSGFFLVNTSNKTKYTLKIELNVI